MSSYKLVYFKVRGKGELTRLVFHAAGVEFEDVRHDRSEWLAGKIDKEESPTGQVPYLVVDGGELVLGQSMSIARFVARRFGLAGRDEAEQAKADTVVDTIDDLASAYISKVFQVRDPALKEENIKKFKETDIPLHLARIERVIKRYGSDGYCVGNQLSWADLYLYEVSNYVILLDASQLDAAPGVLASRKQVEAHEKLGSYLKSRPEATW